MSDETTDEQGNIDHTPEQNKIFFDGKDDYMKHFRDEIDEDEGGDEEEWETYGD